MQMRSAGQLVWRASLEAPRTGERRGFAGLEQLVAFFEAQTGCASQTAEGPSSTTE